MVFVDDQAVPHGEETAKELTTLLEGFVNKSLPMLKRLGGVMQRSGRFAPQRAQRCTEVRNFL